MLFKGTFLGTQALVCTSLWLGICHMSSRYSREHQGAELWKRCSEGNC
jgi:hypothetical protein